MSNWNFQDERWRKAKGETFHQAGQKVWIVGNTVSVKKRRGASFGIVAKDSIFPDLWVWVEPRNKDQHATYWNQFNFKERYGKFWKKYYKASCKRNIQKRKGR